MEVAVSTLRADLKAWIDRARSGEEVVVTERGVPVVRLAPVDSATTLERLMTAGVISRPRRRQRPKAVGRRRVRAQGPVAELVSELRR
jgi:prevent-host-death family protein